MHKRCKKIIRLKRLSILFLAFTAMLAACNPKPGSVSPVPDPQKPDVPTEDVKVTIASNQDWQEGESNLDPLFAALHFHITGGGTIYGIRITGEASDELSGVFMTDGRVLKETVSASNVVYVTGTSAIALPADVYAVIKPGNYSELTLKVFDSYGGSLTQLVRIDAGIAPGKVFDVPEIAYQQEKKELSIRGVTSSTAVVTWDDSPLCGFDVKVFTDSACSNVFASYSIPAGNACWNSKAPSFCVSGLAPATTYWVRVTNLSTSLVSETASFTTEDFSAVMVSASPAAVGDVLLAEDFGELRWDCDMIGSGVGIVPADYSSFANDAPASFHAVETLGEKALGSQSAALASSRLAGWAQGANNTVYIHPGYLKLSGNNKPTHIVTPPLDNIPEGKKATVEVAITASAYYSASSGSFCTDQAVVAVQNGEVTNMIGNNTNALDLTNNIEKIVLEKQTAWKTYTVVLYGLRKGDRLAIGAQSSVSGNETRMNLSDVKVTLKSLLEDSSPEPVEGDNSFSLATYNVLVNDGRREEMQLDKCSDALGKAIKDCQADILCLGELDDIFASQLPSIAQTAGAMEYVWNISNPNKVTSRGLEYYFSNGIAYNPRKFNLEAKGMYWYTSSGEWTIMSSVASSSHVPKYCTFVWAKLRHLPTGKVICVISTHLPLATDGASAGYETGQANYLCANALNSFAAYMQVPCVMGADLNASALSTDANASGYTWLKRRWVDVYERLQKTGQLPSYYETYCGTLSGSSDNYYYDVAAFTKNYPSRRIDHIMYTSGEGCELVPEAYATIMRGYYVGTTRYCPSDHLPVVAEFVIK